MLARRMKSGRRWTDSASGPFWLASALVVVARLSTSPARSSRRSAMSVTSLDEETTNRSSSASSRVSSSNRRELAASDGLKYWMPRFSASPSPAYSRAEPWITFCSDLRVSGSSVLNSSSRSTAVVVSDWLSTPPSGMSSPVDGASRRSM